MLSDKKLNEESFAGKNIQSLPNTPSTAGITTQQLKAAFDRVGEKIIAVAVNGIIDDLTGEKGADNIGAKDGKTVGGHIEDKENPHGVTKKQVELELADNTADMDKPVSTPQAAAIALKCDVEYVNKQDKSTYAEAKKYADSLAFEAGLVTSVFGRAGAVEAQSGDYTPDMVGAAKFESGVFQLTHTKNNTAHTLTGTIPTADIVTAIFKATADFTEGDSFTLNGITFAAQNSLGEEIAGFKSGTVIGIEIDVVGKKLNFKSGGGGTSAQLPSPLTSFSASAGNAQATYTFGYDTDDTALSGIFIVRKVGSMPMTLTDGTKIDIGKVTTYTDTPLENGTSYYVRAFPYNSKKQVQNALMNAVVSVEPSEGILMSELPVGTLVVDLNSKYYDVPIVWKIADQNHEGYPSNSITLITDQIITMKSVDAKEPGNSNASRKTNGNNRYLHANIKQWLNSDALASKWYAAQHSTDTPPNVANVTVNPYDTQEGFLNTFSSALQNALLTTTLMVAKNTITDGSGSEIFTDKIFLASNTEIGLANENKVVEGAKLALFADNASRIATPTAECVSNGGSGTAEVAWFWLLRTPNTSYSGICRIVSTNGGTSQVQAYSGDMGVRPLCNLSNTTRVSPTPNAEGQYEILF